MSKADYERTEDAPPPSGSLSISITTPVTNAFFSLPTNLAINTTNIDSGGTVTQVLFYVGGTKLLGIATNSPYNFIWSNPPVGIHALTAVAMDNATLVATSSVVNVSIATNLTPIADAHVRDGSSTNLNFGTTNMMQCLTTTTNGNNRDIYFKFDLTGISNVSSAQLKVFGWITSTSSITNTVYSVTNTSWTETGITWSNKPARVTALFTNKVTGTNWISYDISSYVKSQLTAGQSIVSVALHDPTNYTLLLSVYSKENTTNTPALVIVTTNSPLSVSITNPVNDSSFIPGSNISLGAAASDTDGTVSQVQYFFGTNLIGRATTAPYVVIWPNPSIGVYSVTAKATDNNGVIVTSFPAIFYVTPLTNMVAWWRAEGNALDSIGTNNGTLQGGAGYTNGEVGQAFIFDGSSGYVEVGNISDLVMSNTFSFDGWIYPTGPGSGGYYGGILINKEGQYEVARASDGTIIWWVGNLPTWITNSGAITPLNQWSHVAVTYSNGIVNTFLNGVLTSTYNGSGSIGQASWGSPYDFRIGGRSYDSQFFQGRIDEVSIYNRALSSGEIAAIYNAGSASKIPSYSVTLTNPQNNTVTLAGSNVSLGASASDQYATVKQIQFFQGTNSLGVVTNAPFTLIWTNPTPGTYALSARATDSGGLNSTSSVVNLIVNTPVTVTLTNLLTPNSWVAGYWTFDNNVQLGHDSSSYGNNLTVTSGTPVYSTNGMFGGALYLNGSSTLTTPSFPAGLPIGNSSYTIALWEKTASGCSSTGGFIGWGNNTTGNCNNFRLNGNNSLENYWWSDDFIVTGLSVNPMDGNWHAIIVTFDGTNRVMYVDGFNVGSLPSSGLNVAANNFIVGETTHDANFTGWIDNLLVANRAFTTTDVSNYLSNNVGPYVVPAGSNVNLGASATDASGTVTQVQFFQGSNNLGIVTSSPYSITWTNPAPGTYALTAVASDSGGFTATSSVVNIIVDIQPSVTLTNPVYNTVVPAGSNIILGASASDADGTVVQVRFFQGTNTLGSAASPPYNLVWSNVPSGPCTLTAVATDNNNLNTTSSPVSIIVDIPPVVSITSPANNALLICVQTNVTLTAAASDADGTVASVQFFQGTNSLGIITNGSYSLIWSNVTAGSYSLTAVAVDNNGLSTVSPAVGFTVSPFSVALTNPVNNTLFVGSQTNIALAAIAADVFGAISQVQFFQGSTSLGVVTSPPYNLTWNNAPAGNFSLTAIATDNNGNTATSPVVNIIITPLFTTNTMNLWLKADAISSLTNGAAVGFWPDSSGWSNNATQSSGQKPTYVTNALNGRPAIYFNTTNNQYLNLTNFMRGMTGAEAFVVLKVTTATPANPCGLWQFGDSSYAGPPGYPRSDGTIGDAFCVNTTNFVTTVYNIGVPAQPLTQFHVYQASSQSNSWSAWINGVLQFVSKGNPFTTTASPVLGRSDWHNPDYSWSGYFDGDIAEVLLFNRALTSDERDEVNGYLNLKYGLVTTAPPAPTSLSAIAASTSQVSLTWSFNLGTSSTRFQISRSATSNGTFSVVATVRDATSYLDTNLTAATAYYYQVTAANSAGTSIPSSLAWATTLTNGADVPLNSLRLWLKADTGVVVQNTNSRVPIWFDQSGNTNDATQGTASQQPGYMTNAFNGRPTIHFNTTNSQFLNLPNFMSGMTGAEAFVVLKVTTASPSDQRGLWQFGEPTFGGLPGPVGYPRTDGTIADAFCVMFTYSVTKTYNIIPAQPLTQFHVYQVSSQSNSWSAWINGVSQIVSNSNEFATTTTPLLGQSDWVNGQDPTRSAYFDGDIAELMIFNRALTTDENAAVGTYLNQKYTLVTNTPAAPINLTATAISTSQINLAWSNTSLVLAEVQIERKADVGGTYSVIAEVRAGVTNYVDSGLISGHVYYYRVRASNLAGYSPYSNEASAIINTLPTISISSPTIGATFADPANIQISANAVDSDGTVVKVDFYSNGLNIGEVTNGTYNIIWSNVLSGTYSLTASATDNLGGVTNSAAVLITVTNIPSSVSLIAPTTNQFYFAPAIIAIQASASDPNGFVSKVDFYYNSTNKIGTVTYPNPFSLNWTNLTTGNYPLTAVATDNEGATSTSGVVNVIVSNSPPTITITSPTINALFQAGGNMPISVNASDANGYVVKVDYYYQTTNFIGESSLPPFNLVWNNLPAGTNSITAKATDDGGATTTSSALPVIINAQPSISITNPASNASFPAPTNLMINATASDSDGTISRVDFYYGIYNYIGTKTNSPYSIVLSNAPFGTFPLTARATDNRGGVSNSSPVFVSVGTNVSDIADSYVQRSHPTNNFGTAASLLVQTNGSTENEDAYFKFNVTATPNVIGAKLYFNAASSKNSGAIGVFVYATATNWTETGINWSNRPALGGLLGGTNISGTSATWYVVDVTSYVQTQRAAGTNVISLAIHATNSSTLYASINSREASSNPPYLQILASNSPPTVSITSPTNNSIFVPGTNVTISATASDDGQIYKVEFFQGSTSLGSLTNSSGNYSINWTNIPFGLYQLTAVATDNYGAQTTSAPVSFNADSSYNNLDPYGVGLSNLEEWLLGVSTQTNNAAIIGNGIIIIHTPLK